MFCYDGSIQHFDPSPAVYCTYGALFLCAATSLTAFFTAGKKAAVNPVPSNTSFGETFFAVLSGLLSVLCGLITAKNGMPDAKVALIMMRIALYFITSVYFFVSAFTKKRHRETISFAVCSAIPILLFAILIPCHYFDKSYALNSADLFGKTLLFVCFMLFFTFETAIGAHAASSARKYLLGACLSVSCGGAIAISGLINAVLAGNGFTTELLDCTFYASVWFYISVKSFGVCRTAHIENKSSLCDSDSETESENCASDFLEQCGTCADENAGETNEDNTDTEEYTEQ